MTKPTLRDELNEKYRIALIKQKELDKRVDERMYDLFNDGELYKLGKEVIMKGHRGDLYTIDDNSEHLLSYDIYFEDLHNVIRDSIIRSIINIRKSYDPTGH